MDDLTKVLLLAAAGGFGTALGRHVFLRLRRWKRGESPPAQGVTARRYRTLERASREELEDLLPAFESEGWRAGPVVGREVERVSYYCLACDRGDTCDVDERCGRCGRDISPVRYKTVLYRVVLWREEPVA